MDTLSGSDPVTGGLAEVMVVFSSGGAPARGRLDSTGPHGPPPVHAFPLGTLDRELAK